SLACTQFSSDWTCREWEEAALPSFPKPNFYTCSLKKLPQQLPSVPPLHHLQDPLCRPGVKPRKKETQRECELEKDTAWSRELMPPPPSALAPKWEGKKVLFPVR
uniref:Uncharacterized protein n=1 Tax=Mustela putorius furo TaxID=9669 RepID=M3Z1W9_MUSPF